MSQTRCHSHVTHILTQSSADRFQVTVDFLLQQVAYLTERHASQVRAQVRKATAAAKGSAAPSPVPPIGAQHQRTSSAFSARGVDSPMIRTDSNNPTPGSRPGISRNTSTNTTVLQDAPASPHIGSRPLPSRPSLENTGRKRPSSLLVETKAPGSPRSPANEREEERDVSPGPAESSSGESSDDESNPVESRIIRRPPRFQQEDSEPPFQAEDDDNESEPAFQPYKSPEQTPDLGSTLRGDTRSAPKASARQFGKQPMNRSQTSDSSTGSGANAKKTKSSRDYRAGGPLSPRRRAEMAAQGSPGRGKVNSQAGSEGTPSMGSSFSDLDGA